MASPGPLAVACSVCWPPRARFVGAEKKSLERSRKRQAPACERELPRKRLLGGPDTLLWRAERNLRSVGCVELADAVGRESARRAGEGQRQPDLALDLAEVPLLAKSAEDATDDDFAGRCAQARPVARRRAEEAAARLGLPGRRRQPRTRLRGVSFSLAVLNPSKSMGRDTRGGSKRRRAMPDCCRGSLTHRPSD